MFQGLHGRLAAAEDKPAGRAHRWRLKENMKWSKSDVAEDVWNLLLHLGLTIIVVTLAEVVCGIATGMDLACFLLALFCFGLVGIVVLASLFVLSLVVCLFVCFLSFRMVCWGSFGIQLGFVWFVFHCTATVLDLFDVRLSFESRSGLGEVLRLGC